MKIPSKPLISQQLRGGYLFFAVDYNILLADAVCVHR